MTAALIWTLGLAALFLGGSAAVFLIVSGGILCLNRGGISGAWRAICWAALASAFWILSCGLIVFRFLS